MQRRFFVQCGLLAALLLTSSCETRAREPAASSRGAQAPSMPVTLDAPASLLVGSWSRIPVIIEPSSGIPFDELEFAVPSGRAGGIVSLSRDPKFDPANPTVLYAAGSAPGDHAIEATFKGQLVGSAKVRLESMWDGPGHGPGIWLSDRVPPPKRRSAWGSPDANGQISGLQNFHTLGTGALWRAAIVLIDTASARFSSDEASRQTDRWADEVFLGIDKEGVQHSTVRYYDEVSAGQFSLLGDKSDVYGPVNLSEAFTEYFKALPGNHGTYTAKDGFWQTAVTESQIDLREYDSVIFVVQGYLGHNVWPHALRGKTVLNSPFGDVEVGVMAISSTWGSVGSPRSVHSIVAHELGHNLGLNDQHSLQPASKQIKHYDIMSDREQELPHFALHHKMVLGWSSDVVAFDINSFIPGVDDDIYLDPAELVRAVSGSIGVQIRVANGRNFLFEHRARIPGQIGDQQIPESEIVLATDILGSELIYLADDGGGAFLREGQSFQVVYAGDPTGTLSPSVSVISSTEDGAEINVSAPGYPRADLSITPWPASEERQWQSPDILVENARSRADPDNWYNVPWTGHNNTLYAFITNSGSVDATNVRVDFYYKDWTVSDTTEVPIGYYVGDLPAGTRQPASVTWIPPEGEHFCIVARIAPYTDPYSGLPELSTENNMAQSNYWRFISSTASPWSREYSRVTVTNPFDEPTTVRLEVRQTNPLYRTYLEHRWVKLEPEETVKVDFMFEYAEDDYLDSGGDPVLLEEYRTIANYVTIEGIAQMPSNGHGPVWVSLGGAEALIEQGLRTEIAPFTLVNLGSEGYEVRGSVSVVKSGQPVPDGSVFLRFRGPREISEVEVDVVGGQFAHRAASAGWSDVSAYYVPANGYADATSGLLSNPTP